MNSRWKFYRVVAGASLGAVLWAACSSSSTHVVRSPGTRPAAVALPKPDPTVRPEPLMGVERADQGGLLNVLSRTAAPARERQVGKLILEPAGSARTQPIDLRAYRQELADEACRRVKSE